MNANRHLTKFFVASAVFFIWVTVQGALQSQKPIHDFISLPPAAVIVGAHVHIGTMGWLAMAVMGALYYLVPLVSGNAISWPRLTNWVFWVSAITVPLNALLMIGAGIAGGQAFQAGIKDAGLDTVMGPYMIGVSVVSIVWGLWALAFAIQIIHTAIKQPVPERVLKTATA